MNRDLSENSRHVVDATAWLFAGVAGVSFWQNFALGVTILAGIVSLLLGCLRIYDRFKYGARQ